MKFNTLKFVLRLVQCLIAVAVVKSVDPDSGALVLMGFTLALLIPFIWYMHDRKEA